MGCFQSKTAHLHCTDQEPPPPPDTNADPGFLEQAAEKVASYNLSDIPDEILSHIISFLPFKDAVCTSVLSRRWRYIFTLMTNLDIKVPDDYQDREKLNRFLDFMDRLVSLKEIRSILRFRVYSCQHIDPLRFHKWISALVPSKIQEFNLKVCWSFIGDGLPFPLPENLFACENLVVLKLKFSYSKVLELKVPARICLPRLKVIRFVGIVFPNDGSEERLFSNCPVLEDLLILECLVRRGCLKFSISNQSLKKLAIRYTSFEDETIVRFLIDAPNMVFFGYSISSCHSLEIIDAKSLVEACIDHYEPIELFGIAQYVTAASSALSQIKNVLTLRILNGVMKDLKRFNVPIPLFDKMTCLKISDWEFCLPDSSPEYFLARCVVLETLVFEPTSFYGRSELPLNRYALHESRLGPLLHHLKTIEVCLHDIKQAEVLMEAIEFFWRNGNVLEELKFNSRQDRSEHFNDFLRKLSDLPAASNKCRVSFHTLKSQQADSGHCICHSDG